MRRALARTARPGLVAVTVTLTLAACGIPTNDTTHTIEPDNVPYRLLEPAATSTSTTTTVADGTPSTTTTPLAAVPLYYVRNDRIELVVHEVATRPGMFDRVNMLGAPLSSEEVAAAYRTAVPAGAVTGVQDTTEGYAIVDLSSVFTDLPAREQVLAFAQITYTLTDLSGIGQVAFTYEGNPVSVLDDEGGVVEGRVTRATYADLFASHR